MLVTLICGVGFFFPLNLMNAITSSIVIEESTLASGPLNLSRFFIE